MKLDGNTAQVEFAPLDCVENALLYDRNGEQHFFAEFHKDKTGIYVFVRVRQLFCKQSDWSSFCLQHFLDYITVEYCQDLAKITRDEFQVDYGFFRKKF